MTQEIKPTYVTFEQAKWLKEKGFDELTTVWRQHGNGISGDVEGKRDYYNRKGDVYVSLPEQHQVVEWLRVNHGIWVQGPFPINNGKWEWVIFLLNEPLENTDGYKNIMSLHTKQRQFNSPQEAYSAAFDYILNNLI